MSRVRFLTAREVFEAFPMAAEDITAKPTDDPPAAFIRALLDSGTPEDAITFSAYVLPRREAVWWACQCVRRIVPQRSHSEEEALMAAEAWVREPEEERRRAALSLGMTGDRSAPTSMLAMAAGWSGGSMGPADQPHVPTPPSLTAKAARAAILTALARVPVRDRSDVLRACIDGALRLAGEPAAA